MHINMKKWVIFGIWTICMYDSMLEEEEASYPDSSPVIAPKKVAQSSLYQNWKRGWVL